MTETEHIEVAHHAAEGHAEPVHAHGHGHGHAHGGGDTKVALLVTVIAALLAVTEISGKGAQTEALVQNVTSNDLWAFYQARTIRQTVVTTVADVLEDLEGSLPAEASGKLQARVAGLRDKAEHWETSPKTNDGKKELEERARETERERDKTLAKYHSLELASAAYELGIVLCSISMMLHTKFLVVIGAALGALGLALSIAAWVDPTLLSFI